MKKNKLYDITQSELKDMFDYDYENGFLIRKTFRNGCPYNRPCGNKPTCNGYGYVDINGKMFYSHQVIWLFVKGTYALELDHIDRNRINNRIENLREVSRSENNHNHPLQKNNSSGFPGVHWNKKANKYHVRIKVNNKNKHIGYYLNLDEAIHAAKLAKIKYHPSSPQAKQYVEELGMFLPQ